MPGRKKSALITRVPLVSLSKDDFDRVNSIDTRYRALLQRSSEKSYHEIRMKVKPYTFTLIDGNQLNYMCRTKTEAIKLLTKWQGKMPALTKITVDLENSTKELVTPEEQKAARKAKKARL